MLAGWLKKTPKDEAKAQPKAEASEPKKVVEKGAVLKENLVNAAPPKDDVAASKPEKKAAKSEKKVAAAKPKAAKSEVADKPASPKAAKAASTKLTSPSKATKRPAEANAASKPQPKKVKANAKPESSNKQADEKRKQLSKLLEKSTFAGTVTPRLMAALEELSSQPAAEALVDCLTQLVQNASGLVADKQSEVELQEKIGTFELASAKLLTASPLSAVSMLAPRGKFEVHWCESVACFKGKSANCVVHYDNVKQMFQLPMAPHEKKTLVVLVLETPVPYMKQTLHQIVMSVPDAEQCTVNKPSAPLPESLSGSLKSVLCNGFGELCNKPATAPSPKTYHTAAGDLGLKAYLKVTEGLLFFFRAGLCFTKPYTFVNASEIDAYEIEATGRTFEINLLLKNGKKVDFSLIDAAEYEAVAKYFRKMSSKGLISPAAVSEDDAPEAPTSVIEGAAAEEVQQEEGDGSDTESDDDEYEKSSSEEEGKEGDESSEEEDESSEED